MAHSSDSVRELIRSRLIEAGLSMAEVSKRMGRNHAYLQQFLEREAPKHLPEEVRGRLATILGISELTLRQRGLTGNPPLPESNVSNFAQIGPPDFSNMVNVLGATEAGSDGSFEWNGQPIDRVPRPPFLAGATQGYALFVAGSSMEPRYHPGETIFVHPGKPVTIGSYVVVQVRPPEGEPTPRAFLKRLVRRTAKTLFLEQFNPRKPFEIPAADVLSIHRVVGSGDT
jgi:phage repressor protein C with HTH and peptisase S24 domain/lambda repressor-like predicted transcriptional regulator